jgi:CxxC-x17-CxxC domain-containing protein
VVLFHPVLPDLSGGRFKCRSVRCGPGPLFRVNNDREPGRHASCSHGRFGGSPCGKPAMEFQDRVLKCVDCGAEFIFTAGEQFFFHDKQFKNDPKRCKQCKAKRASGSARVRTETRTTCSECGAETTVPFKPTQGRPVLCRSCFQKQQTGAGASAAPNLGSTSS